MTLTTVARRSGAAPARKGRGSRRTALAWIVLRRLRDAVVVLAFVLVAIFLIGHFVGDPASAYAPPDATDAQLAQLRHSLGLDEPFWVQFADFLRDVVRLDTGTSIWQQRPAMDAVMEVLPNTVLLAAAGTLAAGVVGVLTGVLAGANPGSLADRIINVCSVVSLSVANFWVGLLLIIVFAVQLELVPTSGWYDWRGLVLPIATLAFIHGGRICQVTRSAVLGEMTKPYVQAARSRGLPRWRLVGGHVVRNAGTTVLTTVGWESARMLGGSLYPIELVFGWPGVGPLMTTSASRHDFPIVEAAVLVTASLVILINLVVDVATHLFDRRSQAT
ncbi:ABC transporter permease [Streptomyces sp. NPDC058280]|uniref:ABC transporter permease n=1 Tax=Streptomyces sp. NPDC058280 TaxID=3346419 RepID=UPI0036E31D17